MPKICLVALLLLCVALTIESVSRSVVSVQSASDDSNESAAVPSQNMLLYLHDVWDNCVAYWWEPWFEAS